MARVVIHSNIKFYLVVRQKWLLIACIQTYYFKGESMKIMLQLMLMALLVLGTTQAKADSFNAIEAFSSIFPVGTYQGVTEKGEACTLTVKQDIINDLAVTISNPKTYEAISHFINQNLDFYFHPELSRFTQTMKVILDPSSNVYTSNIIRTTLSENDAIYAEISKTIVFNSYTETKSLSCLVRK